MDVSCLDYRLTEKERIKFEKDGFFIVEDVLPAKMVEGLTTIADRLDLEARAQRGLGAHDSLLLFDFIGKDELFLELLDHPKTFAKVWGILGWNIKLYHTHLITTPPLAAEEKSEKKRLGWHQDSGRLNQDMETDPRPRISLKVAFFLTDTTETNRGNFHVIPGSHLKNSIELPADGVSDPEGKLAIQAKAGWAAIFDRRIWHSAGRNVSDETRKVLFYGYSYRWLQPRDDMTVEHYMDRIDPIRQQLLGASPNGGYGYTSPKDEDVPLKTWIEEHLGEEALVP